MATCTATTRIYKKTAFFIAHFAIDATYHAPGICEKYHLGETAQCFDEGKGRIRREIELNASVRCWSK
jgi:hypothetical protein